MDRSSDIGTLVKAIANAKDAQENRRLKQYGLSSSQMHVLLYLYDAENHSKPLKELEKDLYVSQSTMAKIVRNLVEEKSLARYESDENDRRIKKVALTPEAIPICEGAQHIVSDMEDMLRADLTPEEVKSLRDLLGRIYAKMKEG